MGSVRRGRIRGATWLVIGVPLFGYLWTYGCLLVEFDRLGRGRPAAALGDGFRIAETRREEHVTPRGVIQPFTWIAGVLG
jgi:hypothetical protein